MCFIKLVLLTGLLKKIIDLLNDCRCCETSYTHFHFNTFFKLCKDFLKLNLQKIKKKYMARFIAKKIKKIMVERSDKYDIRP